MKGINEQEKYETAEAMSEAAYSMMYITIRNSSATDTEKAHMHAVLKDIEKWEASKRVCLKHEIRMLVAKAEAVQF
jgi:hypothetical protein